MLERNRGVILPADLPLGSFAQREMAQALFDQSLKVQATGFNRFRGLRPAAVELAVKSLPEKGVE